MCGPCKARRHRFVTESSSMVLQRKTDSDKINVVFSLFEEDSAGPRSPCPLVHTHRRGKVRRFHRIREMPILPFSPGL